MKRTNVYLEENHTARISEIAEQSNIPAAKVLRNLIDSALFLIDMAKSDSEIEFVRQKLIEKRGGADVTLAQLLDELAREKANEYRNIQDNRARLTWVYEILHSQVEILHSQVGEFKELKEAITRMMEAVIKILEDSKGESNDVQG